jgi:hypothetical protein
MNQNWTQVLRREVNYCLFFTLSMVRIGAYNTGGVGLILHDSPMNNSRNLFFPNKETCEMASMSSRSKTGAKMEACSY